MKRILPLAALAGFLLIPACAGIGAIFGWEYVLGSGMAYAAAVCALALAAAFGRSGALGTAVLPAGCVCAVMLHIGVESRWVSMLMMIALAAAGAVFARAQAGKAIRRIAAVISALLLIPALTLCLFTLAVGTGEASVSEVPSPDGKLFAQVRIVDQGALGGSTHIDVYESGCIPLPFGELRKKVCGFEEGWTESGRLEWLDGSRFSWDGEVYSANDAGE